jgi:hypothetical protein
MLPGTSLRKKEHSCHKCERIKPDHQQIICKITLELLDKIPSKKENEE